MLGRTLSHYKIVEKLGEGGMGAVYRAQDTHLDRPVAIKLLRAEAVADPEKKRRFVQEAKSASALNHPNIITVYDIDVAEGLDYIAMEFVPGKTLDKLIGHKGLRIGEALQYAVQIADALATAHAAGIVHRDIKPANIMVNEKGLVKVVDFGLAKLTEPVDPGDAAAATETMKASPHTEEGTILGTVAYMSPEQAEGRKVDARSDVFSFGAVLYEMTTGRQAFEAQSRMATLSMILHKEPKPLREILEAVPHELERIVTRCLRKDAEYRFQHMDDLKVALRELKEESDSGRLVAPVPVSERKVARRTPWLALAAVLILVGAGAGLAWWLTRPPAAPPALELVRVTSDAGLTANPALSRDGKLLAYASDRAGDGNLDIWIQQVGGGSPIRLTAHPADDREPSFSPDGTKIAFRSERDGGGIYVIPALGGVEQRIADQGRSPRFSPDGKSIAYWVGDLSAFSRNRIYVVALDGGQPRQLQPEFDSAYYPLWSPDGKHLLFSGMPRPFGPGAGMHDWWVTPLEGSPPTPTGAATLLQRHGVFLHRRDSGVWLGDRLIFSATAEAVGASRVAIYSAGLWQIRLSQRTWQVEGPPQRLTSGAGVEAEPSLAASSDGGRLLALSVTNSNPDIWGLPVSANQGKVLGEMQRLVSNAASDTYPAVSADGAKLAFTSRRGDNWDIWSKDLVSGRETALTSTPSNEFGPVFSADGSRVAYFGERFFISIANSSGGGAQRVCETCGGHFYDWSRDGKKLIYRERRTPEPWYVALHDLESRQSRPFLKHSKYDVAAPHLSPDQRQVVFQTVINQTQRQIFVARLQNWTAAGENEWIPITDGSGLDRNSAWSPDGNLLYFLSERDGFRCFWAQRLEAATKRPLGPAFAVQHFHQARRSLMAFNEVVEIGLSVGHDKLVFSMPEYTGNVWMARFP